MPLLYKASYTLDAPNATAVVASTSSNATSFSLQTASGVSVHDKVGKQVSITSSNDLHTANYTITGTLLPNGGSFSEVILGPNNTTVTTTNYFLTVTSVTSDLGVDGNLTVGLSNKGATVPFVVNAYRPGATGQVEIKSGTANLTLQYTLENVIEDANNGVYSEANCAWLPVDNATTSVTSGSAAASKETMIGAFRMITNSYSSTPTVVLRVAEGYHG